MEITVARAVLRNSYWSRKLIGPYRFWVISPRNSALFTRLFLAGRRVQAGHKTNTIVWQTTFFIVQRGVLTNVLPFDMTLFWYPFCPYREMRMEYMRQLAVWVQSAYVTMSPWGSSFIRRESTPGTVPFPLQFGMSPVIAVMFLWCLVLVNEHWEKQGRTLN